MHNMFHKAMKQARINGIIAVNPTDVTTLPRREQSEMRVLSLEEERRLLSVIGMHRLGVAILFDLATGLRIGELCALKWSDINFQKQTVKISRTLQRIKKSQAERDDNLSYGHCTHIIEASVKTLSDILGHSQVQITIDLYCHTSLDHMHDVMNNMVDLFSCIVNFEISSFHCMTNTLNATECL